MLNRLNAVVFLQSRQDDGVNYTISWHFLQHIGHENWKYQLRLKDDVDRHLLTYKT